MMADSNDPPPLFDEDDSRKEDDSDIFASAVQSPIKDDTTSEVPPIVSTAVHPLVDNEEEEETHKDEKGQSDTNTIFAGSGYRQDLFESARDGPFDDSHDETISEKINSQAETPPSHIDDASVAQVREESVVKEDNDYGGGINNSLLNVSDGIPTTETLSNVFDSNSIPAFFDSNNFIKCSDNNLTKPHFLRDTDTTEILLDDAAQEISLKDDDDDAESMFKSVHEAASHVSKQDVLSGSSAGLPHSIGIPYGQAQSLSSSPYAPAAVASLVPTSISGSDVSEQAEKESGDTFIEISVSDPQKIGDGIGSYMSYKVTTKTSIPYFRKKHWSVTRRFSDFLGLHSKLVEKHLHSGVIIPPAPEKAAIATTKIKLGSDKNTDSSSVEFIERRRAALERYMKRTAVHFKLRSDPDFREFLELDAELPKATNTSAISGAGVLRLFNKVGETVNKMTFKMDESDQWFEERTQQIENLDNQLRKLHGALEGLVGYRRELANATGTFSKSAAVLSSVEEHTALSRALHQLAEAMERIHTIHHSQADADFFHLCETTKDYINIIGAVKEVFHERVKTFQTWQHAQATLAKKRENKAKMELTGRIDKVEQANEEVKEWESKVERSEEEFNRISKSIKAEMEQFDVVRVVDFKDMLIKYLEALMASQMQIVKVWESFLPEAKAIA